MVCVSFYRLVFPVDGGTVRPLDKDKIVRGYVIPKGVGIFLIVTLITGYSNGCLRFYYVYIVG